MVIAQVVHVRIEAGAANDKGANADHDNQKDDSNQWLLSVKRIIDEGRRKREEGRICCRHTFTYGAPGRKFFTFHFYFFL